MSRAYLLALCCLLPGAVAQVAAAAPATHAQLARAARDGNVAAAVIVARLVLWGELAGDREAALATLERLAQDGVAAAAMAAAAAHYAGAGGVPDVAAARTWWRVAAAAGERDAAYNLAVSLLADDLEQPAALAALRSAALSRHALACFLLGTWEARHGAPAAARVPLSCAAEQGYAPAQFNLATLAARAGDLALARQWYAAAAATFAPAAQALAALPGETAPSPRASVATATDVATTPPATAVAVNDLAWVLAQPAAHFTLLVAAGSSRANLTALLNRHAGDDAGAVFLHRPGAREPYSAVLGSFADQAAASTRLASLPAALARNAPLVMRYARLQRTLREIDPDAP